jgi:hypothetical protein
VPENVQLPVSKTLQNIDREKPAREQKQIMEQRRYYGITRESFVFWEEFPSTPE